LVGTILAMFNQFVIVYCILNVLQGVSKQQLQLAGSIVHDSNIRLISHRPRRPYVANKHLLELLVRNLPILGQI